MSYVITVSQPTQLQVLENGKTKVKTLLPNKKYIIDNPKSNQVIDLKKVSLIKMRSASSKDESSCENISVK